MSEYLPGLSSSAPLPTPPRSTRVRARRGAGSQQSVQHHVAQWEQAAMHGDQVQQVAQQGVQRVDAAQDAQLAAQRAEQLAAQQVEQLAIQQAEQLTAQLVAERGEQGDLTDWLDPAVPEPLLGPLEQDAVGWNVVDKLGGWECGLCEFRTLEEVPPPFREKWARALATILRRILEAQTEIECSRGLKWFLLSAQILLRESKRGGKKGQGTGEVAARFDCLVRGEWGALVAMWESDRAAMRQRNGARRTHRRVEEDPAVMNARLRKTVLAMLARGQIGRAVRRICSNGVASMDDPLVRAALQAKYKDRGKALPATVTKGECLPNLAGLRETILGLDVGVSPGFGGQRNEHLRCFAEVGEDHELDLLESFSLRYLNSEFPPWFSKVWNSVSTVPLLKPDGNLRPVGVKPSFIRTLHKRVIRGNRGVFIEHLEPQQLAVSEAGGAKLVHGVRMLLEHKPDFAAVKLDIRNAHNEVSRSSILEGLDREPSLRHLVWHAATCLAPHTGLEAGGKLWGQSGEGMTQGDPEAGGFFCVSWHLQVRELDETLRAAGGMARFGNDDGYAIGPSQVLFPALARFSQDVQQKHLLHLQVQKTEVFTWSGVLPDEAPEGIARAGVLVGEEFFPGMVVYGIPVGSDTYVRHMLGKLVDEVAGEVNRVKEVLAGDSQAMWSVLSASLAHKLDWHLSLCYPSDIMTAATRLDAIFWSMLETISRQHIPSGQERLGQHGGGGECVFEAPGLDWLQGSCFQKLLIHQPIKLGGLGLRSLAETSPAAFVGGVEMSLPHFSGVGGVCPLLENVVGVVEGAARWSRFIAAGSRTAQEFSQAWASLQTEGRQCAAFLGKEVGLPLSQGVEQAGDSSVDGSTRRKAVQQRESWRHEVLTKALKEHRDREARPVTVFQNFDKLSGAWLLALPGTSTGLSSSVFAEAMAAHLCLGSPALRSSGWVGRPVGRKSVTIDLFGDAVMNCDDLPGDTWRHRHDTVKTALVSECIDAKLPHDCEVYGLFADLLPAAAQVDGGGLEWNRARQGLIPDFRLRLPTQEGTTDSLAELKLTSAGKTWYPRGVQGRGTDRRANGLSTLYKNKLAGYDTRYHGTGPGQSGPLVQRLDSYGKLWGLVVGPWGDGSKDLHSLIKILGESAVAARTRARGWEGGEGELGLVLGQTRRRLSCTFVRAQALCLLARLGQLGPGARMAADRRKEAKRLETVRRREAQAHWLAHVRGRGLGRSGMIFVP